MGGTALRYGQIRVLEFRGLESRVAGGLPGRLEGTRPAGLRVKETFIVTLALRRWPVVLGPSAQGLKGI